MQHEEELMDVLSLEGKPTGESVLREVIYDKQLPHFIAHVMLLTSSGEFVLQRRSKHKSYMPNTLVSAGSGHVKTGESLREASARELSEEAGGDIAKIYLQQVREESDIAIKKYEGSDRPGFVKFLAVSEVVADTVPESRDLTDVTGFEKWTREAIEALSDVKAEFHPEAYYILKEKYGLDI